MIYKGSFIQEGLFVIPGLSTPLLSFAAVSKLELVRVTHQLEASAEKSAVESFPDLFVGVGKLKEQQIHLFANKTVPPITQPHRRIPFFSAYTCGKEA